MAYNSRNRSVSPQSVGSFIARPPTNRSGFLGGDAASEDEEEELDFGPQRRRKKESLFDLLDSEPPWTHPTAAAASPQLPQKKKFSFPTLLRRVASSTSPATTFKALDHDELVFRGMISTTSPKNKATSSISQSDDDPFARSLPGHTRKLTAGSLRIDSDSDYSDYGGGSQIMRRNDSATSSERGGVSRMMSRIIGYAPDSSADENQRETVRDSSYSEFPAGRNGFSTSNRTPASATFPSAPQSTKSLHTRPLQISRPEQLHHQRSLALLSTLDPAIAVLPPVSTSRKSTPTINTLNNTYSLVTSPTAMLHTPPLTANSITSYTSALESNSPELIPIPDSTPPSIAPLESPPSDDAATDPSEKARRLSVLLRSRQRTDSSNSISSIVRNRPARSSLEGEHHRRTSSEASIGRNGSSNGIADGSKPPRSRFPVRPLPSLQRQSLDDIDDSPHDVASKESPRSSSSTTLPVLLPESPPPTLDRSMTTTANRRGSASTNLTSSYAEDDDAEMEQLSDLPLPQQLLQSPTSPSIVDTEVADGRSERIVSALRDLREALDEMTGSTLDDEMFLPRSSATPAESHHRQQLEALLPTLRLMKKQMKAATVLFGVILGEEDEGEEGGIGEWNAGGAKREERKRRE